MQSFLKKLKGNSKKARRNQWILLAFLVISVVF